MRTSSIALTALAEYTGKLFALSLHLVKCKFYINLLLHLLVIIYYYQREGASSKKINKQLFCS